MRTLIKPPASGSRSAIGPPNHSTARSSAVSAGAGFHPSSPRAFASETHIFLRAMRTASIGTRGGAPGHLRPRRAANPGAIGDRVGQPHRGRLPPRDPRQPFQNLRQRQVLRAQNVPFAGAPALQGQQVPLGHIAAHPPRSIPCR